MTTDLKERPSTEDEERKPLFDRDTRQSIYDDEFEKIVKRIKDEPREESPEELSAKEERAEGGSGTASERREQSSLDDAVDEDDNGWQYTGGKQRRSFRTRIATRRNKIVLAISTAIISALVALSSQLPNLLVNQLKEMLMSRISSVQIYHTRKYRQSKYMRIKNLFNRDTRLGQRMIDEMQTAGYKFHFDQNDKNKILGLTTPTGENLRGEAIGTHVDGFVEANHPLRTGRWKTKSMNQFYEGFGVARSSVVNADRARAGPDGEIDAEKIVNKEVAQDIIEGDQDINLKGTKTTEQDAAKQKQSDERQTAVDQQSSDIGDGLDATRAKVLEGENVTDTATSSLVQELSDSGGSITSEAVAAAEAAATSGSIGSKLAGKLKETLNPLSIFDSVCTIRHRMQAMVVIARAKRSIQLIRYVMVFINASDETRRGKTSGKLLSALMKRVTATDKNGVAIGGSPGFSYLLKSKFSKSRNNITKSAVAVDGQLPGFFGSLNSKLDSIPGMGTGCPFVQNPIIQVGAGVGGLIAGIFSGGLSEGAEVAFQQGFTAGIRKIIQEQLENITLKTLAKDAIKNLAYQLSFEGIMTLTEGYVQKSLKLPFTGQEKGGALGDILVAGMGAANKQRSLLSGMVPATTAEYAQAQTEYVAWHNDQLKQQSFGQRMFSMDNTDSLLFNVALTLPNSATDAVQHSANRIVSLTSSILNPAAVVQNLASVFVPKAVAASDDEVPFDSYTVKGGDSNGTQLATDPAGNLQVIMRSDIAAIDPDENIRALVSSGDIDADTLQPKDDSALAKHIANCVESPDLLTKIESNEDDCLAKQDQTKRFKAYLAYMDMIDGLSADFVPEDIDAGASNAATQPTQTSQNQPVLAKPSGSAITTGQTSVIPGTSVRIATTNLPQFTAMLDAAKKDGINLLPISSGWRDPSSQIALRKSNCPNWQTSPASACHPPTAKPGTSQHEKGNAVDFGNMCYPNGTSCPSNPRWQWLKANAAKYGYFQLKSEAWHWSTTGT